MKKNKTETPSPTSDFVVAGVGAPSVEQQSKIKEIEKSIIKTYRHPIWQPFCAGVNEYNLIESGDKIAVCISGGKDSMLMAKCFQELKKHGKVSFELEFVVMDPGYVGNNRQRIHDNLQVLGIPAKIFTSDIFDITSTVGGSPCYLCARMRRGNLYAFAKSLGCNKIALGHHFDDVVETILMGQMYNGQIQTMMPKLKATNFEGMQLIRPMYLIEERAIVNWVKLNNLSFIRCGCPLSEDCTDPKVSKRSEVKALLVSLLAVNPLVKKNIFRSVYNINLDAVIGYKQGGKEHSFLDNYDTVKACQD
ncbi:MAG: tRNA 2-thiocytidine biosynthesis protein TtcA [Firmicutes bacterium]|nr:tRNA 2-thiocytidine biosynthesis protein TtcA [Bacillota bacterium]